MKKLIVLIILSAAVFSLSTGALAQGAPVASTCSETIGMLPFYQPEQGTCTYFDFQTGYGYCLAGKSVYSNKAIFALCNCPSTNEDFFTGSKIGVRMTILVNDLVGQRGAYWATTDNVIHFGKYESTDDACDGVADFNFGPGHFYKTTDLTPSGYITPYTGTACDVPASQQATVYVTDQTVGGYDILSGDYGSTRWFVQIPPIRIDPAILHSREVIKVKVEFLNQNSGHGICANCSSVCAGEIIVAIVGTSSCTTCTYALVPTSSSFGYAGGSGTVVVTPSESGCSWSAVSNASWITITAPAGGLVTGTGTVSYSVSANKTGKKRDGTVTIAGKTFTVTQDRNLGSPPLMLLLD
jgi:hypothetical protein